MASPAAAGEARAPPPAAEDPPRARVRFAAAGAAAEAAPEPAGEAPRPQRVDRHRRRIDPTRTFDPLAPGIEADVLAMVVQFLQERDFVASAAVLQDEANLKRSEGQARRQHLRRMRRYVMAGDWEQAAKLASKYLMRRSQKPFLYALYKQEYLELIDAQELQKAFSHLGKRLKPLETVARAAGETEFGALCYLLTCKSVQDSPAFQGWEGVAPARERLVTQFESMLDVEASAAPQRGGGAAPMPPGRLVGLLQQAVAYQIEFSRYHPMVQPRVGSLATDYQCFVVPTTQRDAFAGHADNVKCVDFVGEAGTLVASGSNDTTVRLWRVDGADDAGPVGACGALRGHSSRVWDLASSRSGELLLSASADATVRLWSLRGSGLLPTGPGEQAASAAGAGAAAGGVPCVATAEGHHGDVYSVQLHPAETHFATSGFDHSVRLFDARTGQLVRTFTGHTAPVSRCVFNRYGNLLISGSKDSTIRFFDVLSGVCVKTLQQLGEVTSLEVSAAGTQLLSASKNASNRLWDLRTTRTVVRFKGHQNTSKNFIRASFGPSEALVVGGSEDGRVYLWDTASGRLVDRLRGHEGVVYRGVWNARQAMLATCGNDGMVRTWWME